MDFVHGTLNIFKLDSRSLNSHKFVTKDSRSHVFVKRKSLPKIIFCAEKNNGITLCDTLYYTVANACSGSFVIALVAVPVSSLRYTQHVSIRSAPQCYLLWVAPCWNNSTICAFASSLLNRLSRLWGLRSVVVRHYNGVTRVRALYYT